MRYTDAQFLYRLQMLNYWSAMIASGTLSPKELEEAHATHKAHRDFANECMDAIAELNTRQFGDCNKTTNEPDAKYPDGGDRSDYRAKNKWLEG